jgi:hypothetical protein
MTKQISLLDVSFSSRFEKVSYPLESNGKYIIGRFPEEEDKKKKMDSKKELLIKLGLNYNPINQYDSHYQKLLESISRRQGLIIIVNNQLFYEQISPNSFSYVFSGELMTEIKPFSEKELLEHMVMISERVQVFPGDYLIFGNGYETMISEPIDEKAVETARKKISSKTTNYPIS